MTGMLIFASSVEPAYNSAVVAADFLLPDRFSTVNVTEMSISLARISPSALTISKFATARSAFAGSIINVVSGLLLLSSSSSAMTPAPSART